MKLAIWDADAPFARWRNALVQHAGEQGLAIEVIDACAAPQIQADFALVWEPEAEWLSGQLGLRAVFNLGAGVDAVLPLLRAHAPDVPLYKMRDAGMGRQMADYVTEAVLHAYRRMDVYAQQQRDRVWHAQPVPARAGFRIGLLGMGTIGQAVATRLQALDFPLLACTRSGQARPELDWNWPLFALEQLPEFLAQCQLLVVLLPLTADSRGLLDFAALRHLPPGAHLVNAGRGAVLVSDDLLELLDSGHLASATLDVFESEPLPADSRLWNHPKVRVTPHVAAQTLIGPAAAQIVQAIAALERGEQPAGRVDFARGY